MVGEVGRGRHGDGTRPRGMGDGARPTGEAVRPTGLDAAGLADWRKRRRPLDRRKELFIVVLQFLLRHS